MKNKERGQPGNGCSLFIAMRAATKLFVITKPLDLNKTSGPTKVSRKERRISLL
jgi:hypothetical protein